MKNKDWILFAISFTDQKGLSPVRLQKSLFLLGKELPKVVGSNYYRFVPYNYGPFCIDIYQDLDTLISDGYIEAIPHPNSRWSDYRLTSKGQEHIDSITIKDKDAYVLEYLQSVIKWILNLSFQQLIATIYKIYPKYQKNSVFHGF